MIPSLFFHNRRGLLALAVLMGVPASSFGQVGEANPLQYAAIAEGTSLLNSTINSQTKGMQKTAAFQGTIAAEFTKMKQWEGKYNAYLKTARGYADALKAGCSLYADGVQTLQHLYEIQRAINANQVLYLYSDKAGNNFHALAYSMPYQDEMYVVRIASRQCGIIDEIHVDFYASIETVFTFLKQELERLEQPQLDLDIEELQRLDALLINFL